MPYIASLILKGRVREEWIDYNGHMNDAEYAKVFSLAITSLMDKIGLDETSRAQLSYTLFTMKNHLCYEKEALEGETISVSIQLIERNRKLLHVFLEMENEKGECLATSEQMLMGINTTHRRSAPFPDSVTKLIEEWLMIEGDTPYSTKVGRQIGIRKRS